MPDLDPAVRDLLVAIYDALDGVRHSDRSTHAVQAAVDSVGRFGLDDWDAARWLHERTAEAADRCRVKAADTHGMLAENLVPVRPIPDWGRP
jgi:hypothetical protein